MHAEWTPYPRDIVWFADHGRTDLGLIEEPTSRVGRYSLELDQHFVLCAMQARFGPTADADAPTGGATLTLYNHSHFAPNLKDLGPSSTELVHGVYWIQEWADCGVTRDRISHSTALHRFRGDLLFEPGDSMLFVWTNPNGSGLLTWTMRVGLAPVPKQVVQQFAPFPGRFDVIGQPPPPAEAP